MAFRSNDLPEPRLELGPIAARTARAEVSREQARAFLAELSVDIELDLTKHVVAINL